MRRHGKSGISPSTWWVNSPGYEAVRGLYLRGQILHTSEDDPSGVRLKKYDTDKDMCPFQTSDDDDKPLPWIVAKRLLGPSIEPWQTGEVQTSGIREYEPLKIAGLHRSFAELDGSEASFVSFANKYGFLGENTWLVERRNLKGKYFGEACQEWQGESFRMRILLRLFDLFRDPKTTEKDLAEMVSFTYRGVEFSQTFMDAQARGLAPNFGGTLEYVLSEGCHFREIPDELADEPPYRRGARTLLREYVTGMLSQGTVPVIDVGPGSQLSLAPTTLLGAMYVLFMQELLGRSDPLVRCAACGRWFVSRHAGRMYCGDACKAKAYRQAKQSRTEVKG